MREVASSDKQVRVNRGIRAREVRVIDSEGNQLGILPVATAIHAAEERGLDLVEVAPQVTPPVCRIMDYGKFKYEQSKKQHEARKRQAFVQVKEIKIRPTTGENDFLTKLRHARKFLIGRDKVKVVIFFRGREISYANRGAEILKRVVDETADIAVVEQQSKFEGRQMIMVLAPKSV